MITVKLKFQPSFADGNQGAILYLLTRKGSRSQIRTRFNIQRSEWDFRLSRILPQTPSTRKVLSCIELEMELLRRIIDEKERGGRSCSLEEVVNAYRWRVDRLFVVDYMGLQIALLHAENRLATAENYSKVLRSLSAFLGGEPLSLQMMNEDFVASYNAFLLQRGLNRNSISFYMRILRAVYNKAVREKLIVRSNPFIGVYTGVDRTRKRAVCASVIARLYRLDLPVCSQLCFARDLFVFSYATRGMAFVDIAYLKKENYHNGEIVYTRHKTGQLLCVKAEPVIRRIIERYASPSTPYLFPILRSLDPQEAYQTYCVALNTYNKLLGRLSKMLSLEPKLTSYTARHTWATVARDCNIPLSVISAGMGHSSELTTQIYLKSLENAVIDQANKKVLAILERG